MNSFFTLLARIGLVAAFLAVLYVQVVALPGFLGGDLRWNRGDGVEWIAVYVPGAIIGLACVEVVLASAWVLLGMVRRGELLTGRACRWVDAIIAATAVATFLAAAASGHLLTTGPTIRNSIGADEFRIAFLLLGAGIGFGILMLVLRRLLRRATELKAEMSEVI
ncbi:DUF2975 domain-containing protein [Glycomyces luteolus]|uniref:DUF2975 domain-containing protein n=1 Tax=Glycomyces luteolus TaxID=2670330 RepID=A0A9X3PEN9_9ACTN|nr:DUF2975 domain-containing protein [Glycomyces luteolus]MDA1362626.1 DUF2975 domain-containing protein [Glycomyces luteolus]